MSEPREGRGEVRTAAVRRASDILGGPSRLRDYLGVSAIALGVWIAGIEPPPIDVFLKAVDVIVDRDLQDLRARKPKR